MLYFVQNASSLKGERASERERERGRMTTTFYQHKCNIHGMFLKASSTYRCVLLHCDAKCVGKVTFDSTDDTWKTDDGNAFKHDAVKETFNRAQYRERMSSLTLEEIEGHICTLEQNVRENTVGPIFVSELKHRHNELTSND